ncbi:hypothetical protein V2J09_006104 [Rumex salicifolius]
MGAIEEGTVSGCLPSTMMFAVHYPGYPSSITRAIDALGGVDRIEKVRTSKSNKMELYFRPEDPYSHPASGQLYSCKNLLLKISRGNNNSFLNGDNMNQTKCAGSGANIIHSESVENELKKVDNASDSTKLVKNQVPGSMPSHISASIVAQVEEAYHFNGMADYQHVLAVHADVARQKRTWTDIETSSETGDLDDVDENLMILAPPLFSLKDIPENLVLLFRVAYYFGSGPFHRFWIKKGYDPRKDPESRILTIYQRIDFRIPPDLRIHCDASAGTKQRWDDICSFRVFPSKYHLYLQLCELSDDFIQEEITKPPKQTVCTPATGWFTSHTLHTLRLRIALRFLSVRPLPGAEEMLKSISDRFEKSKRIRYPVPNVKPSDEVSQIDEEAVGDDDKEAAVDDEEENEIEDDDAEEDLMLKMLELFGSFPLDAGDDVNLVDDMLLGRRFGLSFAALLVF